MKERIRTLKIDLDLRRSEIEETSVEGISLEQKFGGFGKAIHDIEANLNLYPDLRDAFDRRNLLCFDIGCMTGKELMTARRTIVSGLSPLKRSQAGTNGVYYSTASGDIGPEIRACNLDSIHFIGQCETPVYVLIDNGNVIFQDAREILGKTTDDKIKYLFGKHQDTAFAVIGPAGENKVRLGNIAFSTSDQRKNKTKNMRFAGRGGMGALMGSKNVFALGVRGEGYEKYLGHVVDFNKEISKGKRTEKYRNYGTFFGNNNVSDGLGVGIHDNFSRGSDPLNEQLSREETLKRGFKINDKGCLGCGVRCWKEIEKDGKILGKIDYEPGELLGPNIGIMNIEQIMELIALVDDYGMDSISAGVCVGFEMDKEKKFGNLKFAKDLIVAIGRGEHGLKDGLMMYVGNAPNAMHVKGLEMAAYPGQTNPGYAYALAGPHMSIDTYNGAWYVDPKTKEPAKNNASEWIENIFRGPQIMLYDMNGICKFAKVNFEEIGELFLRIYGERLSPDDLRDLTKRVNLRGRSIDHSLGFNESDDVLPENCFRAYPGSRIPHFNTKEFFDEVKKGVYEKYSQLKL